MEIVTEARGVADVGGVVEAITVAGLAGVGEARSVVTVV